MVKNNHPEPSQRLDYLYKEYARLNEKIEEHIKGSFEDFKLLGATGASIVIWKPIADVIISVNSKIDYGNLLFVGLLSLLLIFAIIGYLILVRSAFMLSIFSSLQSFENAIREELGESESSQVFSLMHERDTIRFSTAYRLTYGSTFIILVIAVTFIPFVILCYSSLLHAGIYLLLALLITVSYIRISRKLANLYTTNFKFL